jgi:hypothetical protein
VELKRRKGPVLAQWPPTLDPTKFINTPKKRLDVVRERVISIVE